MIFTAFSAWIAIALALSAALLTAALYLLKPPPRRLTVSSNLIWDRVLKLKRIDTDRWRWWISLILAALIAAAMALSLGRPQLSSTQGEQRRVAIVIDNSPSMAARNADAESRLDHAKRSARAVVDAQPPGTRFLIADTMRAVGSPAFLEAYEAVKVLESLEVSAGAVPRYPQLDVSRATRIRRDEFFFSDGVAGVDAPDGVKIESVFEPAPNAGITAFDVRTLTVDPRRAEAFVEVGNAASTPIDVTVSIAGAGRAALEKSLTVPARGFASHAFSLDQFSGGALRASLRTQEDALDIDNSAFAFLPLSRTLRVALVTTAVDRAIERALRLDPRVTLSVISPKQYTSRGGFDVYVFDRFVPPVMPAAPSLLFHPSRASWLPAIESSASQPTIDSWLPEHPLLENISFRDVRIERTALFNAKTDNIITLVKASGGRALAIASEANPRWVAVGFAPSDSNFAEQPSLPMFLSNALTWLSAEEAPIHKTIGTIAIPYERAKVNALEGDAPVTRVVPRATLVSSTAPNFYTAEADGKRQRILVNVLDPAVTDINASALPQVTRASSTNSRPNVTAMGQPWLWLLLFAFAFMVFEWFTYHRRVTV